MIRAGFLSDAERKALTRISRDGLDEHRVARRANSLILLDRGWSCEEVAEALAANIRRHVKRLPRKYGYLPDLQDAAVLNVLQ